MARRIIGVTALLAAHNVAAGDKQGGDPAMMGVDLGNEYMKSSLIKDRKFDIALNVQS